MEVVTEPREVLETESEKCPCHCHHVESVGKIDFPINTKKYEANPCYKNPHQVLHISRPEAASTELKIENTSGRYNTSNINY